MDLHLIAKVFNTEIPKRTGCAAAVENGKLVVRNSSGEKIIIMPEDGFILIMPANKRRSAAKTLLFDLQHRFRRG